MISPGKTHAKRKGKIPPSVWWALACVYVIGGSTCLAIRLAIAALPTFFMAGARFLASGLFLYIFTRWRGAPRPARMK